MYSRREELLKILRGTPIVLRSLVRELDEAAWRRRPDGEWRDVVIVERLLGDARDAQAFPQEPT